MNFTNYTISELIKLYSDIVKELKSRRIIRTKNITGELGESIVIDFYNENENLPNLKLAPISAKNYDAIDNINHRYSIKTISTNQTGAFHGMEKDCSYDETLPLFEFLVVVKLNDFYEPTLILELDWKTFFKYKHWHSRINCYDLIISGKLKNEAKTLYPIN